LNTSDELITVKTDLPAYGGFSLARGNGSVLLIRNAIPGETVAARIEDRKQDVTFASAVRIYTASPDRIEPSCPSFGTCGGCHNQYISYPRQVKLKEEILRTCISRVSKKETNLSLPFLGESPWNFRYRGRFKVRSGAVGFYRENSREIVDIKRCPLMRSEVNDLFSKAREILRNSPGLFEGISDLHISYGDEGLALLKSTAKLSVARRNQIGMLFLESGFEGVSIISEKTKMVNFGTEYIPIGLDGLKYTVSSRSFFQGHWDLNRTVVRFLRQTFHPLKGKRVIVLYAGGGNFALPLAFDGADVYAVEENLLALEDGKRNANANGIRNCRFMECSAERLKVWGRADALVVAPPKQGLSKSALAKILTLEPDRIAYISCNPSPLARDLTKLLGRYELESVRIIDCLPHTYFIKSIVVLRLR
jgi:23S rRNA (uracil1939-C5)-methyltransferase